MNGAKRHQLLEMQLEMECVRVEQQNTLVPFPCAHPDTPSRVLVVDFDSIVAVYYRHDLQRTIRDALEEIPPDTCLHEPARVRSILVRDAPGNDVTRFRVGVLEERLHSMLWSDVVQLAEPNEQGFAVFGIVVDNEVISACSSVRENDASGEAYVFTDERFRGRGYGTQVVAAWADALQQAGKVPFYSHLIDNVTSARLAQRLGVSPAFEAISHN